MGLAGAVLALAAGCASTGSHLVGTVAAVAPQTRTLVVRGNAGEETTVRVTDDTHFWSGRSLDQIQTGDRVSLTVEQQGDGVTARSIEIFPAGRPRTRWIGPGGY
jgi:type IV pilus biogenesis protein CpaD/CtpE